MPKVAQTNLEWRDLAGWVDLVYRVGGVCRPSTPAHERCARLYRSLSIADVRLATDLDALERAERLFDLGRYGDLPGYYGLRRVYRRSEMGAFLVEIRNRGDALRSGRADRRRSKGPQFDPARLPDHVLDRLIQAHPDLSIVEQLRIERGRRASPINGSLSESRCGPARAGR